MGRKINNGIKKGILADLDQGKKVAIVKAMSRIMEDSYRRGLQHGVFLYIHEGLTVDAVSQMRHEVTLDKSPENENGKLAPRITWGYPAERLFLEYWQDLMEVGLSD